MKVPSKIDTYENDMVAFQNVLFPGPTLTAQMTYSSFLIYLVFTSFAQRVMTTAFSLSYIDKTERGHAGTRLDNVMCWNYIETSRTL